MDETTLLILVTAIGVLIGWAITVPVHRYKEQRPMSRATSPPRSAMPSIRRR